MSGVLRSLFFSSYIGFGGGETSLLSLLGALDRRRHEPILVCPRGGQLPQAARELGVETHLSPYRGASTWFIPALWARLPAADRLGKLITQLEPELIHSDFHTLPYLAPACRELGLPLIFTCYGWWFRPKPWQRGFFRHEPAAILAISHAVKRGFIGDPPRIPPDKVRVLHLGVDTTRFRPCPEEKDRLRRALDLPEEAPLVTMMARFQDVKGHEVFLQACRRIALRHSGARFAVAGENVFGAAGDEAHKRRILSLAESDAALRERATFTGWVSQPEKLLAASDVVVSPSRFESFGMVLVEAMACGVPVVSTNVGGPSETVVEGETGFLVPPERPDLIAERVSTLLCDEGLRRRMGAAGRARVEEKFELSRYAAGFSQVVESLVDESNVNDD